MIDAHFATALPGHSLARSGRRFAAYLREAGDVRRSQAEALARLVREADTPVLLAGDFNSPPGTVAHRTLVDAGLQDAFARAGRGFGFTYSSGKPLLRIDWLLVDPSLAVRSCRVPKSALSDHRPVVADLVLPAR